MKKRNIVILALFVIVFSLTTVLSISNISIQADESIDEARLCIDLMKERGIPSERVNELFNDAKQQYNAQIALETTQEKDGKYDLAILYSAKVCEIKESAFKAQDELEIFNEEYNSVLETTDLSEMNNKYNAIQASFNEERFEETPGLINEGYTRISEIQASQTALRLFTSTITGTLKNFIINNWLQILIAIVIILVFFLIFRKAIKIAKIHSKLKKLQLKKQALTGLIKKLQKNYFSSKNISETEYSVKIEKFKNMIRDVDRQIPLLKEEITKIKRKGKPISLSTSFESKSKSISEKMDSSIRSKSLKPNPLPKPKSLFHKSTHKYKKVKGKKHKIKVKQYNKKSHLKKKNRKK